MTPPAHYYHDLDVLHAEYDHLCRALVESREASASRRCGDSPDVASPAAAPPPPRPDPSSRPESRHSPQPGPSSRRDQRFASQDHPRPRDASSDRSHHRGISEDRSRNRFAASGHSGDRRRFASGDSPSPKRRRSSRASSDDASFERPTSRSSPAHPSSPSREDRDPDDSSVSAPVRAMVDYILQTFPESQASPSHLMWRFPRVRFWLSPMPFLILSRRRSSDSPVVLRMGRLVTPFCLLSTGSRGYLIRPLRGKN